MTSTTFPIVMLPPELSEAGGVESMYREAHRLHSLSMLYRDVSEDSIREKVVAIGALLKRDAITKEDLAAILEPEDVTPLYSDFTPRRCAEHLEQDLVEIKIGAVFQRSVHGVTTGVTFVRVRDKTFVVKELSDAEVHFQQVYSRALMILNDPHLMMPAHRFIVSRDTGLVDTTNSYALPLIPGAPMINFIRDTYPSLNADQKRLLFGMIGKTAVLDLALGNKDRFVRYARPTDGLGIRSNLGNFMIHIADSEEVFCYLIDNDPEDSASKGLLQEMLGDSMGFSRKIVAQIRLAAQLAQGMSAEETEDSLFVKDLKTSTPHIQEGCELAIERLRSQIGEFLAYARGLRDRYKSHRPVGKLFKNLVEQLKVFAPSY